MGLKMLLFVFALPQFKCGCMFSFQCKRLYLVTVWHVVLFQKVVKLPLFMQKYFDIIHLVNRLSLRRISNCNPEIFHCRFLHFSLQFDVYLRE